MQLQILVVIATFTLFFWIFILSKEVCPERLRLSSCTAPIARQTCSARSRRRSPACLWRTPARLPPTLHLQRPQCRSFLRSLRRRPRPRRALGRHGNGPEHGEFRLCRRRASASYARKNGCGQLRRGRPRTCVITMSHRNVQPHVSIKWQKVACNRLERALMGCAESLRRVVGALHQCSRVNKKNEVDELSRTLPATVGKWSC